MYGLAGGGKSAVPFQGHNVSTVATDQYAVSVDNAGGCGNSNVLNVAAYGPSHSGYYYWQVNGTWYGPLQFAAPGTVYSAPSNQVNVPPGSNGLLNDNIAFEGPNHSLYFVWQIGTAWYGPLQIGPPGSTYSAPSVTIDNKGNLDVAAQGPSGSLDFYWAIGGAWNGPLQIAGPGTTFSTPNTSDFAGHPCTAHPTNDMVLGVSALGPHNESLLYWDSNGTWLAPATSGTEQEYSSPSSWTNHNSWETAYVGPGNSLIGQYNSLDGGTNAYCVIGGAGTSYSAPTDRENYFQESSPNAGSGSLNFTVDGPSHSLYLFWTNISGPAAPSSCGDNPYYGPLQLNGAGTTFSVPAEAAECATSPCLASSQVDENVFVEGPSHTLWNYFNVNGVWNGPLQVGGPGSTYDSNS